MSSKMQSTNTIGIQKTDYSIPLIIAGLIVAIGHIAIVTPITSSLSVNTFGTLQTALLIISAIGLILSVANIGVLAIAKRLNGAAFAAGLIFLIDLLAPAIMFFVGFALGGAG